VVDESSEMDAVDAMLSVSHRINWFHIDRPVTGTTSCRQSEPTQRLPRVAEDYPSS
jgi:hypothetical protein